MNFVINDDSNNKIILEEYKKNDRVKMHSFHRYYGKLIPAIPDAFINIFSKENELIFDPFCGSCTTGVEALKNNRNFLGVEINPLSYNIAKIKTTKLDVNKLMELNCHLIFMINNMNKHYDEMEKPFLINRDHWFKDFVQDDLLNIRECIEKLFNNLPIKINQRESKIYKNFYLMCLSSIIKNVSNADTMHVFPGVSKRMRRLEEEGKIHIDVRRSFERTINSKAQYYLIYNNINSHAKIINADSTNKILKKYKNSVDLIVTNPPYISSVRYIETLKLEMYWMQFICNQEEYSSLAHKMLGNDCISKKECENIKYTKYEDIDVLIDTFKDIDIKSAKIVSDFFINIEKVIKLMNYVLKVNKKVVIKISDSKMKKVLVETGKLMTLIAEKNGFKLVDVFLDEIKANSRSLTTYRNSYSDIITHDYIIIWEKINDI